MFNIAVFVSGGGTNLQAIIDRIADGTLAGIQIAGVVASRSGTFAELRALKTGIPCVIVNRRDYQDIVEFDRAMISAIAPWSVDLIVLAGFLSHLGPALIEVYRDRIINIHPSLIPAFCGTGYYGIRPHEAVLAQGVKVTGATVHIVDKHYDQGPIITQKQVAVKPNDTPQILQQRVMEEAEQVILPQAIALFAAGRIRIEGRKAIIEGDKTND